MNTKKRYSKRSVISFQSFLLALFLILLLDAQTAYSSSITIIPGQYSWVKGDVEKFRALNWTTDGYLGGFKDLLLNEKTDNGLELNFNGYLLQEESDYGGDLSLNKEDLGALDINYGMFRKYYDGSGGYYSQFSTLAQSELNNDLHVDMGSFEIFLTPSLENLHDITFSYKRHSKDGTKSRLTWAAVKEGTTTRNIAPVWQDISENTDTFSLEGKTTIAGFNVTGKQIFESYDLSSLRVEKNLSTTSTAADKKIRRHFQDPTADSMASFLKGDKWFKDDSIYFATVYGFQKMDNDELENIIETDENGNPKNFSSSKTRVNALAQNEYLSHTVTNHFMSNLTPNLKFTAKLKTDYITRDGESIYPYDASPSNATTGSTPDGVIEAIDYSEVDNSILRWGQNIGLRYNGISRLALYGEVETSETKNNIYERQENISRVLQWERDTVAKGTRAVWTLGSNYHPFTNFSVTTQLRRKFENNNYEDKVDTVGAINSAFLDAMKILGNEYSNRFNWKISSALQTSFRYQYVNNFYISRVQALNADEKSRMNSHVFTYDVNFQPLDKLFLNLGFSQQLAQTRTPAAGASAVALPWFNADVSTVLSSASYAANEDLSYTGTFSYSWSDNFNDFSSTGLPLGISNTYYNLDLSSKYAPKNQSYSIEPHYAYYNYQSDDNSDLSNYSAHVAWLDFNFNW